MTRTDFSRPTLIGTTDVDHDEDPDVPARIDAEEVAYLCDMTNRYFRRHITPGEVVWSYSGLRPLLDDLEPDAPGVMCLRK